MSNFYLYKWQYNLHDDDLGIHLIFFLTGYSKNSDHVFGVTVF